MGWKPSAGSVCYAEAGSRYVAWPAAIRGIPAASIQCLHIQAPLADITLMTQSMTNNPRIFLWIALALALWLNYEAWVRDYHSPAAVAQANAAASKQASAPTLGNAVPQASTGAPATQPAPAVSSSAAETQGSPVTQTKPAATANVGTVHIKTDVLDTRISLQGGTIVQTDLQKYPKVKGRPEPVRLQNQDSQQTLYLVQLGLTGGSPNVPHPTRRICPAERPIRAARTPHMDRRSRRHR
jgi:YidC/Oxa1 family membrane protein insertase